MEKKNIVILVIVGILILGSTFLFLSLINPEDPTNLPLPSITGKAVYQNLSYYQLRNGIPLDQGWNIFDWPYDASPLPVSMAFKSLENIYYYIYEYPSGRYYFNPNQIYASYNNNSYYITRLFNVTIPGVKYGIYMSRNATLIYPYHPMNLTNVGNYTYPNGTVLHVLNNTIIFPNITTGNVTIVFIDKNSTVIVLPNQTVIEVTNTTTVNPNGTIITNSSYQSNGTNVPPPLVGL